MVSSGDDSDVRFSHRNAALAAIFCESLGNGLIFGFEPPLIALALGHSGSSTLAIGMVTAATLVAVVLLGPLYPIAIARFGPRRCILSGVGLSAVILALMPIWPHAGFWLVLRLLTGCALGLSWISSEVWMNGISGTAARGTVLGIYGMVFSAGVMAGPALLEFTGTRGWQPFLIGAGCLVLTLLPLGLMRNLGRVSQPYTPLRQPAALLKRVPVIMLAAAVAGLIESAELTLLPLFGVQAGNSDQRALLMVTVFMAGNVVLQIPIGLLSDRFGRRTMLGVCAAVSTIGPWLLHPWLLTPGLLWPLLFIWGGTLYAFYSQGVALLGAAFPAPELPSANTLFVMIYCLGGVLGPSIGGSIMDAWPSFGLQALLSSAAAVLLAALVFGMRGR
jgi:MFS family permease